jgi:hypothetical protein
MERLRRQLQDLQNEIKKQEAALRLARASGDREGMQRATEELRRLRERQKMLQEQIRAAQQRDTGRGRGRGGR